jgi:outer membrane biosynthesis protein TonB
MSGNRYIRRGSKPAREPKIGRMLLVSLGLHLLVFLIFSDSLIFEVRRDPRPVYYVDLTQMPVANPQAGRPDARPKTTKKPVQKEIKKPVKKTVVKKSVEKKPVKKSVAEPKPKPKPAEPVVSSAEIQEKIAAMQRAQEREELKKKLAALASVDNRSEDALDNKAPIGEPDGQGSDAGVSQQTYLQAFLKAQWSLSRYQVRSTDINTRVRVVYNRTGQLISTEVLESSGEPVFDNTVKMAILKGRQLPFEPPHDNWTQIVNFNLKELLDQ